MDARDMQAALVEGGLAATPDEAAHMLYDSGEIEQDEHEQLLSAPERQRVYG